MKSGLRYFQNTTGKALEKLTFLFIVELTTWALISTQELSEELQSAHESLMKTKEYSRVLMNTHKYVAMVPWVLMRAVQAMGKSANACLLVVMSAIGIFAP